MRLINATLVALLFAGCDGFVGEANLKRSTGPSIPIVDADYVILRPVNTTELPGAVPVSVDGGTVYYLPSERILDLRQLDPRTAKIEEQLKGSGNFAIRIDTNPDGDQLLGSWTSANLEKQLGIFVDGRLISAPVIKSRITGMIVLDGEFTKPQAQAIVARLRRGGAVSTP